jgi:hypothetical protein
VQNFEKNTHLRVGNRLNYFREVVQRLHVNASVHRNALICFVAARFAVIKSVLQHSSVMQQIVKSGTANELFDQR